MILLVVVWKVPELRTEPKLKVGLVTPTPPLSTKERERVGEEPPVKVISGTLAYVSSNEPSLFTTLKQYVFPAVAAVPTSAKSHKPS
jgi:hypothetical protein